MQALPTPVSHPKHTNLRMSFKPEGFAAALFILLRLWVCASEHAETRDTHTTWSNNHPKPKIPTYCGDKNILFLSSSRALSQRQPSLGSRFLNDSTFTLRVVKFLFFTTQVMAVVVSNHVIVQILSYMRNNPKAHLLSVMGFARELTCCRVLRQMRYCLLFTFD